MITPLKIQVRFSDLDSLGHVNNAVYLSYFELARVYYFSQLLGQQWDWKKFGLLLVKNEIQYHQPVYLYSNPEVQINTVKIGTKSFELSYKIVVDGMITTTGASVLVSYDFSIGKSIPVPEKFIEALNILKVE